jgi:hypothetical protein
MTTKADFTAEEWQPLLQAPAAVGLYIMTADKNFVIGCKKEAMAISDGILKKEKESNSELLASLLAEFKNKETAARARIDFDRKDIEDIQQTTASILKQAADILNLKATPEESTEIRQWLYDLGVKAANAAKEGGFLGFGGVRVSDAEKAALRKIAWILGLKT